MDSKKQTPHWKQKFYQEFVEYWLNVLYLALFFSCFSNYRRLILAHYDIIYENYGVSLIKAMVLAKVVLVAEKGLRLGRGFEDMPLIVPTLYKSVVYNLFLMFFSVVEALVRDMLADHGLREALAKLVDLFTYEWFAGALVAFFAFIPYFAMRELGRVLGKGRLTRLFLRGKGAIDLNSINTDSP